MRQKKIKLVVIFLLSVSLISVQAITMNVKEKTGALSSFDISQMKRMVFLSGSLIVVNKSGEEKSFLLNEIQVIDYSYTTAIKKEDSFNVGVKMFPNIVRDVCTLNYDFNGDAVITIVSISGKIVFKERISSGSTILNFSSLNRGIYFLKFERMGKIETQKFIKL